MTIESLQPVSMDKPLSESIAAARGTIEARLATIVPSAQTWPARLHEAQRPCPALARQTI